MELRKYLKKAQKEKWAIGQFNTSTFEALSGIFEAAKKLKSPFIVGTSEGESKFIGLERIVALVNSFKKETGLPVVLNLDHGQSLDYIKKAIKAGYKAIHFDGSCLPFKENLKLTKKIAEYCHRRNVIIEGEVGFISGSSEILKKMPKIKKQDLTDPKQAEIFIRETRVDSLAINIGTFHGMKTCDGNPHINLERLKEINKKIGDKAFLVLHGGSGTPEKDIKSAIRLGIAKININTELRVAYTNSLKKAFKENPKQATPYKYLPLVIRAVQGVVEKKIKLFQSDNKF
jgi:ketose-bisphosphate aldolase